MKFKMNELDVMLVIDIPAQITKDELLPLDLEMKTWLLSPKMVHVLNFKDVLRLDARSYKSFIFYNKALREAKKHLYCINMSEEMVYQLRKDGMSSVLVQTDNLDAIRKTHVPAKTSVDVSIINPFITSTQNVLEMQANTKVKAGRPYMKAGEDPFPIEIAGLISLNSPPNFKGAVVICFQSSTFLKIYSNMVGEQSTVITPEIQDGAGELINIIYGQAKTILNENGHKLGMALPTVLVGEKLKIRHQSREMSIILPFDSAAGSFFIEILIEKN